MLVDVAPFADAEVVEEVLFAEFSKAGLGELFEVVVEGFPDIEQREEVGVGVVELGVGLAGGGFAVHGALAGVLYRECGCDD